MDTALYNGDFALNPMGKIYAVSGMAETLQRCKILLTVRQGSFCYNPALGSNLHLLRADDERLQGNAMLLVREALLPLPQVKVIETNAVADGDIIKLTIVIQAYNHTETLEVNINENL